MPNYCSSWYSYISYGTSHRERHWAAEARDASARHSHASASSSSERVTRCMGSSPPAAGVPVTAAPPVVPPPPPLPPRDARFSRSSSSSAGVRGLRNSYIKGKMRSTADCTSPTLRAVMMSSIFSSSIQTFTPPEYFKNRIIFRQRLVKITEVREVILRSKLNEVLHNFDTKVRFHYCFTFYCRENIRINSSVRPFRAFQWRY